MAYNFPDAPANGDIIQTAGRRFEWDGPQTRWEYRGLAQLNGTTGSIIVPGTNTWTDASSSPTTLTSAGCVELSLDNVTFTVGPISVSAGTIFYTRWNTGATCDDPVNNLGATITGTITDNSNGAVETYSKIVDVVGWTTTPTAPTQADGATTSSFTYGEGAGNATSTGCIEFNVNGGAFSQGPTAVTTGDTIATRWIYTPGSGTCADSAHNTTIVGTFQNDSGQVENFSLTIDKVADAVNFSPATSSENPSTVTTTTPSFTLSGVNAPVYIWAALTTDSGGVAPSTAEFSTDGGTTYTALAAAPGTNVVNSGDTIQVRFTTNNTTATTDTLTVSVGESVATSVSGTYTVSVLANPWTTTPTAPTIADGITTSTFTYGETAGNVSSTDCIEFSVNGGAFSQGPTAIIPGATVATRWIYNAGSGLCGDAPHNTTITGTFTNDSGQVENFSLTIDKVADAFSFAPAASTEPPSLVTSTTPSFTLSGTNAPISIWAALSTTSGGTAPSTAQFSVDNGTAWTNLAASPGTDFIEPGAQVFVRFTTGDTVNTTDTLTVSVGPDVASKQDGTYTVAVSKPAFANVTNFPTVADGTTTASTTWANGSTTINSTGCIEFSVDGGTTYTQAATAITDGTNLLTRWKAGTGVGTTCADAVHGTTITGSIEDATNADFASLVIDRQPDAFTVTDQTGVATSTATNSATFTLAGTNATSYLQFTGDATDPLTTPQASIAGGAFTAIPAAGTYTLAVPPGSAVIIRGTTGATIATAYKGDVILGDSVANTSDNWSVTTSAALPTISQPSITAPADASTGITTSPTVTTSAYTPVNSPGPHNCTDWELYEGGIPLTSSNTITAVTPNNGTATIVDSGEGTSGAIYDSTNSRILKQGYEDLYESTDGGATWTQLYGVATIDNTYTLGFNQSTGTICLAEGNSTGRQINRFDAGTSTWSQRPLNGVFGNSYSPTYNPSSDTWMCYVSFPGSAMTLFYSVDDGLNWTKGAVDARGLGLSAGDPRDRIAPGGSNEFMAAQGSRLVYTNDNGATLTAVDANLFGTGFGSNTINDILYDSGTWTALGASGKIYQSTDNGSTWSQYGTTDVPEDVWGVIFGASKTTAITSGKVYESVDGGASWDLVYDSGGTDFTFVLVDSNIAGGYMIAGNGTTNVWYDIQPSNTTITITNAQTDGFVVGDIIDDCGGGAGPGTITSVDDTQVTLSGSVSGFAVGENICRVTSLAESVTCDTINKTSWTPSVVPLNSGTKYAVRARYNDDSSTGTLITSDWSAYSTFTTS